MILNDRKVRAMARQTDGYNEEIHFQTGRFAVQNSEWFYMIRDGTQRGPFKSKVDAEGDLNAFLLFLQNMEEADNNA